MFIDVRLSELASRKIISMDNMEALLGISNLANHSRERFYKDQSLPDEWFF
jgi:hypothetical protein